MTQLTLEQLEEIERGAPMIICNGDLVKLEAVDELIRMTKRLLVYEAALDYITEHEWAVQKPKWAAEFVEVAREALQKGREIK